MSFLFYKELFHFFSEEVALNSQLTQNSLERKEFVKPPRNIYPATQKKCFYSLAIVDTI